METTTPNAEVSNLALWTGRMLRTINHGAVLYSPSFGFGCCTG